MITLAVCLFSAALLFAQPQKSDESGRKKEFDRIQAEKVAFITSELDLTPEEAQVFWPVYNQCWKESMESHRKMMMAFAEFRGKKADALSDKEIEAKLEEYIAASDKANSVLSEWYPKFKKVLPIRKVAKLYQAEEAFQQKMINNLRKHSQPRPPLGH